MIRVRVRRGLDLPVGAAPVAGIHAAPPVRRVAVLGRDLADLHPRPCVTVGDQVRLGDPVLTCAAREGLRVTAPGAGRVEAIERGQRRALLSLVIALEGHAAADFPCHPRAALSTLTRAHVVETLHASGLWTALRARPFDRVPPPDPAPTAVLVTAMDTRPYALDLPAVIAEDPVAFLDGLVVLASLTPGRVIVCRAPGGEVPVPSGPRYETAVFAGPHPAGLPGTHIESLLPVDAQRSVWHVGAQDVMALGRLFTTGRLVPERVVALGGLAGVGRRQIRARLGASTADLLAGLPVPGDTRTIAGCVLHGHTAAGAEAYLGRYEEHLATVPEAEGSTGGPTTALHGRPTVMLPLGLYERVWPFAAPILPLLRALLVQDGPRAVSLGCLALAEEDLALCTYVCPGKLDYGAHLREVLGALERGA